MLASGSATASASAAANKLGSGAGLLNRSGISPVSCRDFLMILKFSVATKSLFQSLYLGGSGGAAAAAAAGADVDASVGAGADEAAITEARL